MWHQRNVVFFFFFSRSRCAARETPKQLYQLLTATCCTDNDDSSRAYLCIFGVFSQNTYINTYIHPPSHSLTSWPLKNERGKAEALYVEFLLPARISGFWPTRLCLSVPNEEGSEWWKEIESWDESSLKWGHPWEGKQEGSCRSNTQQDIHTLRMSEGKLEVCFVFCYLFPRWCCKYVSSC